MAERTSVTSTAVSFERQGLTGAKVLAVRVGRAGDMVMITPALRAILDKHPGADVHLLTSPDGRRVLRGFDPRVTRVLVYERRALINLLQRRRLRAEIAAQGYQHLYCFETNPSYRRLVGDTAAETHYLEAAGPAVPFPERCLQLVGARSPAPRWSWLPLTDAGQAAAHAVYAQAGIDASTFVVGLHPSFSGLRKLALRARDARRRKAWPPAHFAQLARLLVDYASTREVRLRVVCDLLPQERPLGVALARASGGCVTLFTEPPDFERYKATIARMNLLVTPDTGPMHIAAAVGTPMAALFCGRSPRECGPYTDPANYVVLRAEEMARPERGLAAIPPEAVFEACRPFLLA